MLIHKKQQTILFGSRSFCILLLLLLSGCVPSLPLMKEDALPIPDQFPDIGWTDHNGSYGEEKKVEPSGSSSNSSSISLPRPEGKDQVSLEGPPSKEQNATTPIVASPDSSALKSWKVFFSDPALSSLIEIGLKNNQELRIVEQEINLANNEVLAREGEYIPKVGIGGSYSFEKPSQFTSEGASDLANQLPGHLQVGRLAILTTWEIDIWGKLRNATKAAYLNYLSSIEGKNFLVTKLVSEVANVYFELLALDNQLQIVDSYVEVLKKLKVMMSFIQSAGRTTSLSVKRFEAEVLKNQSRQIQLQQKIILTQNRLNNLIGRYPQPLERDPKRFMSYELSQMDTGLPSSLLDNRPDIKSASYELEASKLSVKSAKAQFYPGLSMDAGVGFESFNSKHFLESPGSLFYSMVGKITAPLLNRKAIKATYFSASNKQLQAVYKYEQTLVKGYTEVVNELNQLKNLSLAYSLKSKQVAVLNEAISISNMLFQAARVDYLESLLTQRDSLEAQVELIDIRNQQLSAYINLYKALGGGWREADKKDASSSASLVKKNDNEAQSTEMKKSLDPANALHDPDPASEN